MEDTSVKLLHLLEANRILSSTLDSSLLLRQVMKLATEVVGAETSSLLMYDEKTNELIFNLALTDKESQLKEIRLKAGEGIAGWVVSNRKTAVVNDTKNDPRWERKADDKTKFITRSILAVPMIYKDRLLGVVEAVNKKGGDFTEEDGSILESFAAQAAVAVENARLFTSLNEEKEKIETIFSQMSDGVVFVDPEGKKILVNRAAEKILGRENTGRENLRDIFKDFEATPPVQDAINLKDKLSKIEFFRPKGKTLYLGGMLSRVTGQGGSALGIILIFRDITDEKREGSLKSNFVSLISHKLKTPLTAVLGYSSLLSSDNTLTAFQKKALDTINKQGSQLVSLVDKLIYFAIVEADRLALTKQVHKLSTVLERVLGGMKQFLGESAVKVEIDDNIKNLPDLKIDAEKIEAVVKNIMENAVKFNQKSEKKITVCARKDEGFSGLEFRDNGPGIPAEERDKLFQKFYQIEEYFTGQIAGAGLGLALVKQIVQAHKGRVGLESVMGEGSNFYFLLPEKEN